MSTYSTDKPRLILIHTECLHLRGGEKYIYELVKRISKNRPVVLFVENINEYWENKYKVCHVPVYLLKTPRHFYWALLPLTLILNIISLRKFINQNDMIFATNFPISLLATFLSKNNVIFCFEPLSIFYDRLRLKTVLFKEWVGVSTAKFFYEPLDHLAVKRARILATLNTTVGNSITNRYHRSPELFIPNGVDSKFFSPNSPPLFSKKNNMFIIGHSTDYTPLKGTELLLNSLPLIVKKHKSVLLLISDSVPNIQMQERYKKIIHELHIQKYVRFIGLVPEHKLPGFYTSCDVFCYCGSTRCVGGYSASLSVIEAASCGIPVLRTQGNADEIIEGKTGFYFPLENSTSIADTILSYMNLSKKDLRGIKLNARKHVATTFSWDTSAETIENLM